MSGGVSREGAVGVYRCVGCGHGRKLTAWAHTNVYGRLLADGSVEESYSDQWETREDSIECREHLAPAFDAIVEKRGPEGWMRWGDCPDCAGSGRVPYEYENGLGRTITRTTTCDACYATGVRWSVAAGETGRQEEAASNA